MATKVSIGTVLAGLLIGLAVSAYAHTGSGYLTGPLVFLGVVLSALGSIGAVISILIGKRGHLVWGVGGFSLAVLLALVVLPLFWPYPRPHGPVPLSEESTPTK